MDDGDRSVVSVIGVYLTCLDQGVDCYREHLVELERVISESELQGPVMVLGDFNAHLGGEIVGEQNLQGVLLQEVLERCSLSAVSQGAMASGPRYTFCSGDVRTTVDYILMDVEAASMMVSCHTHPMEDLNTSDHLPLMVGLYYSAYSGSQNECIGTPRQLRVDWDEAGRSGALDMFASEVQVRLAPLLVGVYDDPDQMSREIELVAGLLTDAAEKLLPHVQPRRKAKWRDDTLSHLCAQSRAARAAWKEAGRPGEGPLFDEKCRLHRAVRKRLRFCAARSERVRVHRRERMFAARDSKRFRTPQWKKSRCAKLAVGGEMAQDPEALLQVQKLMKSRVESTPGLCELKQKVEGMETLSHENEEFQLDVPFTAEEVARAIARLKGRKAPGPDGLMAEYLKSGGEVVVIWLLRILNAVVELEVVPDVLKEGLIVPVYKGGGKDPLRVDSYRGVTLTSVVVKVLEFLFLERLQPVCMEAGLPHVWKHWPGCSRVISALYHPGLCLSAV